MSEAIKTFQTLDTNSKNLANYPKGEPAVCFEKMYVYVYKVSYCENGEMKDNFRRHNRLEAITLIGIVLGWRCPGVICYRGQSS